MCPTSRPHTQRPTKKIQKRQTAQKFNRMTLPRNTFNHRAHRAAPLPPPPHQHRRHRQKGQFTLRKRNRIRNSIIANECETRTEYWKLSRRPHRRKHNRRAKRRRTGIEEVHSKMRWSPIPMNRKNRSPSERANKRPGSRCDYPFTKIQSNRPKIKIRPRNLLA